MGVNLSVKNVPEDLVERLRRRAKANHRSLQGELMAILEEAAGSAHKLGLAQLLEEVRRSGLVTPDEATRMIRDDRDGR
jgi:plasmid stability protein